MRWILCILSVIVLAMPECSTSIQRSFAKQDESVPNILDRNRKKATSASLRLKTTVAIRKWIKKKNNVLTKTQWLDLHKCLLPSLEDLDRWGPFIYPLCIHVYEELICHAAPTDVGETLDSLKETPQYTIIAPALMRASSRTGIAAERLRNVLLDSKPVLSDSNIRLYCRLTSKDLEQILKSECHKVIDTSGVEPNRNRMEQVVEQQRQLVELMVLSLCVQMKSETITQAWTLLFDRLEEVKIDGTGTDLEDYAQNYALPVAWILSQSSQSDAEIQLSRTHLSKLRETLAGDFEGHRILGVTSLLADLRAEKKAETCLNAFTASMCDIPVDGIMRDYYGTEEYYLAATISHDAADRLVATLLESEENISTRICLIELFRNALSIPDDLLARAHSSALARNDSRSLMLLDSAPEMMEDPVVAFDSGARLVSGEYLSE